MQSTKQTNPMRPVNLANRIALACKSTWTQYALAIASVLLAALLRALLDPWLGDHLLFITFLVAVVACSWYAGVRASLPATILSFLLAWYLFLPARWSFSIGDLPQFVHLLLYLGVSLALVVFGKALHVAKTRARDADQLSRRQADMLHITFASIGDAIITTDAEGQITSLNSVAQVLTGWTHHDAIGKPLPTVLRLMQDDHRRPTDVSLDLALTLGHATGAEAPTTLVGRDGTQHPIETTAASMRDDAGHIVGYVLILRDITERRQAEESLRRSEQQLTDLFDNAAVGLNWVGPDGIIVRANQAVMALLGYEHDEYVGHHIAEFHVDRAAADEIIRCSRAAEQLRDYSARLRCHDGEIKDVLIDSSVFWEDGRFVHIRCFIRDVTERKRAMESIRHREQQLQLMADFAPVLLAHCGHDLRYKFANLAYSKLFGLEPADLIGKHMSEVLDEQTFQVAQPYIDAVLAGQHVEYELDLAPTSAHGAETLQLAYGPEWDADGQVVGFVAAIVNVTDRRRDEIAIRRLAAIVESSYDAIVGKNLNGTITSWNRAAESMFGYTAQEIIGKSVSVLMPAERATDEQHILQKIARGEKVERYETLRRRKDGSLISVSLTVSPTQDANGRIVGASKIARDITEQKRIQEALQEREYLFRTMGEVVPDFLWMAAGDGQPIYQNRAFLVYAGITEGTLGADSWQSLFHPDDLSLIVSKWTAAHATGASFELEIRLRRHDGEYRWFQARTVPVKDSDGRVIKWVGTLTDIHRLKTAEAELRQADRRKDEFLATLAHELRNPLAPMRNAIEMMKHSVPRTPQIEQNRLTIERQLVHLTRLVDDLLDVSRITRDKLELRQTQVELATVVYQAIEACRPAIETRQHELSVTLPNDLVFLSGDAVRLAQVFANLLNNACKYTNPGGRISLLAERQDGQVVVSVKDSGIGIAPEVMPTIFEMFTQADQSLERSQGGLGIGLTLARRLIEMHGGTMEANSAGLGQGSEFVVRLPERIPATPTAPSAMAVADPVATPARCRILVVDDNVDSATSLAMLLRVLGNDVQTAYDGHAALEVAERFRPDVALLDIGLPKLNGYDTCRRIREQSWGTEMILIAVTGWGQDEDKRRSHEAGFDHHLVKPLVLDDLNHFLAGKVPSGRTRD